MKAKIMGMEIEGTPAEILEIAKELNKDAVHPQEKQQETIIKPIVNENIRQIVKLPKLSKASRAESTWTEAECNYLMQNWIGRTNKPDGMKRRTAAKHNRDVAKVLGRTIRGCSSRYWLLMHPDYKFSKGQNI